MTMSAVTSISGQELDGHLLSKAYHEADRDFRVEQAKVGCILVLICMPLGSSLDWFVYPHLFWRILVNRLLCDAAVAPIFAVLYTSWGRRFIGVWGFIWPVLPALSISWMIYISQGAVSPYYAGLNLVIIVACNLMPYTLLEALGVCLATLAAYLAACWAQGMRLSEGPVTGMLFNNVYFTSLTALICVTSCHTNTRRRMQEFGLRYEVDLRNKQLAESYEQLSQLDKLKSQFFANISHELRTPLTLILAPVEELLRRAEAFPSAVIEPLRIVRQNGLRLLKLITDLLEIVRLEEGRLDLKPEPVDLDTFLAATVDSVRHLATLKGLELRAEGHGPLVVDADPARLEKIALNILTNAIKFTPAGGSVTTRWRRSDGHAVVEFRDTGVGIAAEELPHIFDRFRQADGSTTRKYQGMGIGLSLARELVQQHGGALSATSELGKGTTLRMDLPLSQSHAAPETSGRQVSAATDPVAAIYHSADRTVAITAESGPADTAPVGQGPFTVLVVDDEPDMRRFLVSVLASDYRVFQAADGKAGLDMIRQHRPHLVLLDLMLPVMDGLDVCQAVKSDEQTRNVKVLLLTARTDEHSKITALQRGADDFLTKPFSTTEVRTRLANLLLSAQLEENLRQQNVQLEETLARLKETEVQLVQSEKMNALGKLAAGLLHEIHNPLNFTLMALQVAKESGSASAEIAETLDDMEQGMNRIRDIISDLRTFAYPSKDKPEERFQLDGALTTAMRLVSHETDGIQVKCESVGHWRVLGSKTQIIQVFVNLLINAAQAMEGVGRARTPEITVSAEARGGRLQVTVRDNGKGVRQADLPRLFEPFFTTKEVGQGMGLGLSICHTIVKNHGGTLAVRSEEGQWTEVSFDLPYDDGAPVAPAAQSGVPPHWASTGPQSGATRS